MVVKMNARRLVRGYYVVQDGDDSMWIRQVNDEDGNKWRESGHYGIDLT